MRCQWECVGGTLQWDGEGQNEGFEVQKVKVNF